MSLKNKKITFALFLSGYCLISTVYGEESKSNEMNFTGSIDTSYNYLQQSNLFTSNVYNRVFDLNQNGVTLQQAAGTASYLPNHGFGMLLNAMIGRDAVGSNAYGMGTWTNTPDFGVDVTQGFLRYSHSSNLYFDAGKFTTINGAETISPTTNTNFSRSILFGYAGPFTTLGLRSTYVMSDKLKFILGMNDGWDTIRDFSRGPTLEFGNTITFNSKFSLASTLYSGNQRLIDKTSVGTESTRTLLDFLGTMNVTDKFTALINYDYAWQNQAVLADGTVGRAIWNGVAGYLNYQWSDAWHTSLRGEVFSDAQGYRTGVEQTWKELTFTLVYIVPKNKNIELRGEVRRDFSNVNSFLSKNSDSSPANYQQSFALEALYKMG